MGLDFSVLDSNLVGMKPIVLLVCVGAIAACSDYGRPGSPVWFNKAPPEVKAAYFQDVCAGYGYQVGTDDMRDCIAAESRAGRGAAGSQAVTGAIVAGNVQSTVSP